MTAVARLLGLTAPFHRSVVVAVLLTAITIGANVALLATAAYLISKAGLMPEVATLTIAVTSVRLFAVLRASSRYGERLVTHGLTFRVLAHLRAWFYEAVEPLAPARVSRYRTGDLLARSIADIETLEGFYVRAVVPPIAAAVVAIAACALLAAFEPLAALALLALLTVAGVLPLAIRWATSRAASEILTARSGVNALMVDHIQGVADLLMLDAGSTHAARLHAASTALARAQQRMALLRSATSAAIGLLASCAAAAVLALGARAVAAGELDGVYLAVLPLVALASFEAVQQIAAAVQSLDAGIAAGNRVFELIDSPPAVTEPLTPEPPPSETGIVVRNLAFAYHPDEPNVLDGLSFEVAPGERLALAGESGAGKSTVVNLLVRFWDYDAGRVLLGGRDLRQYTGETVRSLVSVMPQDVHLFNTTLRDNLLLANPDASDTEIVDVLQVAQLGDCLSASPDGLDTRIGENGMQLSGGERQRLALARALLKDAPVYILDEPTANLDPETERRLLAALESRLAGRTVLLISHRPAVLAFADRVVTLAHGRAVA